MIEPDWMEVCLSGGKLDEAGQIALQEELARDPENLELRIRRLGYLGFKQLPRAQEVLWLVTNHPSIDLGGFAVIRRNEEPELYDRIRERWKQQIERSPDSEAVRENAARFASLDDPSYSETLYREGALRAPSNPKWPESIGSSLLRRSKWADPRDRSALAREAVQSFLHAHELQSWDFGRHLLRLDVARAAVVAGDFDLALAASDDVLRDADQFKATWQYGNSIHHAHIVRGKVAHLRGDHVTAAQELLLAAQTPGSPQLNSFGPDRELAQWLIDDGALEVARDYLTQCKSFWRMHYGDLDRWIAQLLAGERTRLEPLFIESPNG